MDERERILNFLGEDFLSIEELRTYFPDRYRKRMSIAVKSPEIEKTPDLAATFGQSQGLRSDNYVL